MRSEPSTYLREPVSSDALRQIVVKGNEVLRPLLPHLDGEVEICGIRVPLLFGLENLLLQARNSEVVAVLQRAQRQHVAGVDLVQNAHFGVQARIAGKRVLFEIGDLLLHGLGIGANIAYCGQCGNVRSVRELKRGVNRLQVSGIRRIDRVEVCLTVGQKRNRSLLIRGTHRLGSRAVCRANPPARVSVEIVCREGTPLGKRCAITRRHVLQIPGHLKGQVVLVQDLLVGLPELSKLLDKLAVTQDCNSVVGWVVDDSAEPELRLRCDGQKKQRYHDSYNGAPFCAVFHPALLPSVLISWPCQDRGVGPAGSLWEGMRQCPLSRSRSRSGPFLRRTSHTAGIPGVRLRTQAFPGCRFDRRFAGPPLAGIRLRSCRSPEERLRFLLLSCRIPPRLTQGLQLLRT